MDAQEKRIEFIKFHLKPFLKNRGFKNSNQTWWKDRGDFYNVINFQNYSWNTKDKVDFRLNLGIALKATVKDKTLKKISHFDSVTHLDEGYFLPDRNNRKFGNGHGYTIKADTNLDNFIISFFDDFENFVLPNFEKPQNLYELIDYYKKYEFWGKQLEKLIRKNKLL